MQNADFTATAVHYAVENEVRKAIRKIDGTMPEDLPTPEKSIAQLEKEQMQLQSTVRPQNPFDDGAAERLCRMGLLSDDGNTEMAALSSLSRAFAGLMFDDLCDRCQDYSSVQTELQRLFDAADHAEPRQRFLLACLQYDRLFQVLPDPIWWISGTLSLAGDFAVLYT